MNGPAPTTAAAHPRTRLATRLAVVMSLVGLVAVTTVGAIAWLLAAREARAAVDAELRDRADVILTLPAQAGALTPDRLDQRPPDPVTTVTTGFAFALLDGDGRALVGTDLAMPDGASAVLSGEAEEAVGNVDRPGRVDRVLVLPLEVPPLAEDVDLAALDAATRRIVEELAGVALARNVTETEAALRRTAASLAGLGLLVVVTLAAVGTAVGRRLGRPLDELADAADVLSRTGEVAERIEVDRTDEVGRLATSFNRMLSALEVSREQQQRLVADASHELRTPLAAVRTRSEFLAANPDLPAPVRQGELTALVGDAEHLTALVADLVDLAADVRGGEEPATDVNLGALATEVAGRAGLASGREVVVVGAGATVRGHEAMLARALRNLVDNAVKYAEGPIEVHLDSTAIEVRDHGSGIEAVDRDRVFDRFYRSTRARTRPGNGIGLAIVAAVAEAHGGTTWVRDAPSGGAAVGFSVGAPPDA